MSSLFSHTTMPAASVAHVVQHGLAGVLVPRLNHVGARECAMLLPIIRALSLTTEPDVRTLRPGCDKGSALSSAGLYHLCHFGGVLAPYVGFVWENYAPSRVRFFAWLLVQARIQTRDVLLRKHIVEAAGAGCPICSAPLESADHLIFDCPFAQRFWSVVGVASTVPSVELLHTVSPPALVPERTGSTFLLLCCWQLWKHRNAVIFENRCPSTEDLIRSIKDDARLWAKAGARGLAAIIPVT